MTTLLWADDESTDVLDPLERRFRRADFHVDRAITYEDAINLLEHRLFQAVLLDVILPYATGTGALSHDLGVNLAEFAAVSGVKHIGFLTVTRQVDFWYKIEHLQNQFPDIEFEYFDKLELLGPGSFTELTAFLRGL